MSYRAPVPGGLALIQVFWAIGPVGASEVTNGFWISRDELEFADEPDLQALLSLFIGTPLNDLLSLVPSDVSCSLCRLTRYGTAPLTVQLPGPNAVGAGGFSSPINAALVLSWRSLFAAQRSRSTTWLPLPHDDVDENRQQLTPSAYGSAQATTNAFMSHMNALVLDAVGTVDFVTLHRRIASGGVTAASFSPIVYGHPSRYVGTLDRRIRSRGRSPSA